MVFFKKRKRNKKGKKEKKEEEKEGGGRKGEKGGGRKEKGRRKKRTRKKGEFEVALVIQPSSLNSKTILLLMKYYNFRGIFPNYISYRNLASYSSPLPK